MKIRMITDSASDMIYDTRDNFSFLPLTVTFGDKTYEDGVNLSHKEFYEKLIESDSLPTTSQVSPAAFEQEFEKIKAAGDQAIVITISSGLSGTYQSACIAAEDFPGTIYVIDSQNVTIGEHALIEYGMQLINKGMAVEEIVAELNQAKNRIHLVALLDTLEYLKRGGRISRTAAFAGGLLSIKPVIDIKDGVVNMLGKARGSKQGHNLLVQEIEKAGGINFDLPYYLGYTGLSDALLQKYIEDSRTLWADHADHLDICTVGGAIGTHSGPGAIAVAFFANQN